MSNIEDDITQNILMDTEEELEEWASEVMNLVPQSSAGEVRKNIGLLRVTIQWWRDKNDKEI
jgi:hypothetical protein